MTEIIDEIVRRAMNGFQDSFSTITSVESETSSRSESESANDILKEIRIRNINKVVYRQSEYQFSSTQI